MNLEPLFDNASSVMTLISFVTFLGILWWTFSSRRKAAFDVAARLPFADDDSMAKTPAAINIRAGAARRAAKEARRV